MSENKTAKKPADGLMAWQCQCGKAIAVLRQALVDADDTSQERVDETAKQEHEPVAWVDLIKEADEIVRGKVLRKRFIDDTPLANDIAVWMAYFAQKHASPPKREWVGLTEREVELIDEMIETQLLHAERCDHMANSTMAQKQKAWDLERVELLRKLKEKNNG